MAVGPCVTVLLDRGPLLCPQAPLPCFVCRGSAAGQGADPRQAGAEPESQWGFQARWGLLPVPCHGPPGQPPGCLLGVLDEARGQEPRLASSSWSGWLFSQETHSFCPSPHPSFTLVIQGGRRAGHRNLWLSFFAPEQLPSNQI